MSDNHYNNHHQSYSSGGGQYYPPLGSDGRYGGSYNQNAHSQSQGEYSTYRPPTDEGYRSSPVPPNMQVTTYDDDRAYNRRSGDYNGRARHGDSATYDEDRYSDKGHYLPPPSPNSRRPSSRGSHKDKDEKRKSEAQSIGATILGGVAGALIGRKAGKKDILPTVLGGVAGAWGGHKLEEEFVERRDDRRGKSHDRRSEGDFAHGGRGRSRRNSSTDGSDGDKKSFKEKVKTRLRSLSRKRGTDEERSRSRKRGDSQRRGDSRRRDDSEDSYDDRRRYNDRRYDSESRQDRDSRYDRF